MRLMRLATTLAAVVTLTLIPNVSWSQTIGTWSPTRSFGGFADHKDFEEARAAIASEFPSTKYNRLDTLTPENLAVVDVVFLDTVGGTPLSASEQSALSEFVNGGGTLFTQVFPAGSFLQAAQAIVAPFGLEPNNLCNNSNVVTHAIPAISDPIVNGPFGVVSVHQNRFECHLRGVGGTSVESQGGIVLAGDENGPTLVLIPRGVHGLGQALFFTNYTAFTDANSNTGGLFSGANDNDTLLLNVIASSSQLNHAPIADAGADRAVDCAGPDGTPVMLNATGSNDPDGDLLTFTWTGPFGVAFGVTPTVTLSEGAHEITLTVDDGKGGSSSDSVTITIQDATPPDIVSITTDPNSLWPVNHKMIPVNVLVTAYDACGETLCFISEVTSNEASDGNGDGKTETDWEITGELTVNVRAERSGKGAGRIYTITVICVDSSGNTSTDYVEIPVGHDRRK